jgi:rare lipoprotein A
MKKLMMLLMMMMMMANASEIGVASHYSTKTGTRTASGERLVDSKLTAAHKTLKFGTLVKVTNLKNNKTTVVKITDRGPYIKGRVLDVSQAAAKQLGFHSQGVTKVKIETIRPEPAKKTCAKQQSAVNWLVECPHKIAEYVSSKFKQTWTP